MKDIVLYGAGGLAAEMVILINDINCVEPTYNLLGFLVDPEYYVPGESVVGYPVLGDESWLLDHKDRVCCTCAIGHPSIRKRIQEHLSEQGVRFETLIHPTVKIPGNSHVGDGTIICHYCSVSPNVTLGKGCFMNGYSAVGHDASIGNYTVINPRGQISGKCQIGDEVMIGGASFINSGRKVGEKATVVPGSIVFRNVKPGTYVMGNPARRVEL